MPFWSNFWMPNANSPIMEQLIFFHDHSMIIILLITFMIFYMMINITFNKITNHFLLENHNIEIIWTILPAMMLIFIALPSLRILYLMDETFNPTMTIKIIGHQWYWSYEYPDFNMNFDAFIIPSQDLKLNMFRLIETDNHMVITMNSNIRLLVTSLDVIHSWTIPSLGLKIDAIPGRINQLNLFSNRPGLYFGQCSEICGANHSFMPITAEIVSLKNFMKFINK